MGEVDDRLGPGSHQSLDVVTGVHPRDELHPVGRLDAATHLDADPTLRAEHAYLDHRSLTQ